MMTETNVKGLNLLKEAVPGISRVAVIFDPATPSHGPGLKAVETAGPALGLRVIGARAQRDRVRQRIYGHRWGARRRCPGPLDSSFHRRGEAARRTLSGAQAAFALWTKASCAGRGPHELLA